jgi:hypothetical protein
MEANIGESRTRIMKSGSRTLYDMFRPRWSSIKPQEHEPRDIGFTVVPDGATGDIAMTVQRV